MWSGLLLLLHYVVDTFLKIDDEDFWRFALCNKEHGDAIDYWSTGDYAAFSQHFTQSTFVRSQTNKICRADCWNKGGALLHLSPIGLQHTWSISFMTDDMQIGCHPIFSHNLVTDTSQVENRVPRREVDTIAGDATYWRIQPNVPFILLHLLFICDRDSHVPAMWTFQAQRTDVGSIHLTMGGAAIKHGICWTNFIIGGWNGTVKTQ